MKPCNRESDAQDRVAPFAEDGSELQSTTRKRIIEAAATLFREQGYAAVSLRAIAGAAGLTTGSVYYYFESKDHVVREILELAHELIFARVRDAVAGLASDAHATQRLEIAIEAHIVVLLSSNSLPAANMRIFSQVPKTIRAATLSKRHEYEGFWSNLLADCQQAGALSRHSHIPILTALVFGAMNWLLEWFEPERHTIAEVVRQTVMLIAPTGYGDDKL